MITKRKRKPAVKVGKVTGTVRLSGKQMEGLRRDAYYRSNACCEMKISPKCWQFVTWEHGELAHIKSKGSGGADSISNVLFVCKECHRWQHNGGKPCNQK